jgi:hypothetical protein
MRVDRISNSMYGVQLGLKVREKGGKKEERGGPPARENALSCSLL